jgi:very-short-patch-repair endonuclease
MKKLWSEEEKQYLKKLYEEEGLSVSELSSIFNLRYNRPIDGLKVKIGRLKLRHTKEQIKQIKSRLNSGELNGMFGRVSPMNGLTMANSEIIRIKSEKVSKKRKDMFKNGELIPLTGSTNPMYGSIAWNNGLTKHDDDRIFKYGLKISKIKKLEWENKTEEEKSVVINRLNDAMIQNRKPTKIEIKLNEFLSGEGIKFESNHPIKKFRVDFYLNDYNLVIECDGDYWHGNPKFYNPKELSVIQLKNFDRDKRKEEMLESNKIDFIRFWEYDIKNNFNTVKQIIWEKLQKK